MTDDFSALFDDEPEDTEDTEDTEDGEAKARKFYGTTEGQRLVRSCSRGQGYAVQEREFYQPVGTSFFAKVLRLNQETVRNRLKNVTPVGQAGKGTQNRPLYDFASTVPYLVKPKMDLRTYIRSLNPADMPTSINKAFWEAERIKNKTFLETGEAWPTERVLEVLGQVFMMIKDRIPLITDALQDMGCSDAQMNKLQEMCDQFQNDLYHALCELPKNQETFSREADIGVGIEED